MNLSIILPILNEEKVIENSIQTMLTASKDFIDKIEIITVNDGSTDNTLSILEKLAKENKSIRIISHSKNKGYGACLRSGIEYARYDWIFLTDADMQFDIKELASFIPYTKDYDYVIGYRKNRADSARRKIISFIYNRIVKFIFGIPLHDVDCAFKLMKKKSLEQAPFFSNSFFVSAELMVKSKQKGIKIKEVGVTHYSRKKGVSKVTYRQIILTIKDLLRLYTFIYL